MARIRIYNDMGVSPDSLTRTLLMCEQVLDRQHTVCLTNSDELAQDYWQSETDLLIMPGGRARAYTEKLRGQANQHIIEFVQRGGSYLGICAGAYYAAQHTVFEKGGELECLDPGELNFYPGIAEGPAYGLGTFRYDSEAGAKIAKLSGPFITDKPVFRCFFNGGCFFHGHEADNSAIVPLAYYHDLPGQPLALLETTVGEGRVVLSGAHFEYAKSVQGRAIQTALLNKLL